MRQHPRPSSTLPPVLVMRRLQKLSRSNTRRRSTALNDGPRGAPVRAPLIAAGWQSVGNTSACPQGRPKVMKTQDRELSTSLGRVGRGQPRTWGSALLSEVSTVAPKCKCLRSR